MRNNTCFLRGRKWAQPLGRAKQIGLAAGWSWRRPGVVHRRAKSRFAHLRRWGRPGLSCFQNGFAVISRGFGLVIAPSWQSTGAFISSETHGGILSGLRRKTANPISVAVVVHGLSS